MTLRQVVKKIIAYTIEGEYKVYRLKHTPFRWRYRYTRKYHKLYDNAPVSKNKIIFENYMGNGYGCNCKYVLEELLRSCPDLVPSLELVWITRDAESRRDMFPKEVRLVEYGSEEAFKEYATATVWVKNFQMVHYMNKGLLKKEGQFYIQMWHGSFGIKKIEGNCGYLNRDNAWIALARKNVAYTDYWISNSDFESRVYREAFWGAGKILEYGHPRNDIFFGPMDAYSEKVRSRYGIGQEKIVLYVPTFRDRNGSQVSEINVVSLLCSLEKRFGGDWICMIRKHPRMLHEPEKTGMEHMKNMASESVLDVSEYPDIQELLATADVVITDYSSAIFDFMLSGKPGFLLAEDYEEYEDLRGLYYPLEDTPFPLAHSQKELCEKIENFDQEEYSKKCELFLKEKGSVEDGNASERVVKLLEEVFQGI